jgi:glycosyltransferase involved in cell wall biosynthesis
MVTGMMQAAKKAEHLLIAKILQRRKARRMHTVGDGNRLAVNLVTSWDRHCGIATYSEYLAKELAHSSNVYVIELTQINGVNPYFKILGLQVGCSRDIVHVQFEYGIFPKLKIGKRSLSAFAALPFYLGLSLGNRYVVTTMHEPRKQVTSGGKSGLLFTRLLDKLIFSVSDRIVVHTEESKKLMQTVYGVEATKLRVIPHGSYQRPKFLNKEKCKTKLGLEGKTVVTILGFVTPKKGHDIVIPLLPNLNVNVELVIAGGPKNPQDERYLAELKKLAKQHHCEDRVTFTGYLDNFIEVINATDIALLPYRYVTDSGVLHLLTAYKVPIIASDVPAFNEVYDEFGCLMLFENGNTADLLARLQVLLSNPQRREQLKKKCDDMWEATKWSNVALKHVGLYRELLSKH